jgi:hypothetical protein
MHARTHAHAHAHAHSKNRATRDKPARPAGQPVAAGQDPERGHREHESSLVIPEILRLDGDMTMSENQVKVTDWLGNTYYIGVNPSSTEVSTSGKTFKNGFASIKVLGTDTTINVNVFTKRKVSE